MTDFQLTPAEAALLLRPRRSSATNCLQCALLALLAKSHLSIERGRGLFTRSRLQCGAGDGSPLPQHHQVVKDAVFARGRQVATSVEVAAVLRTLFGSDHRRYVHNHVGPALVERGLLERSQRKWLGLVPYIHYEHSVEGRRRAEQIGLLLDELAQLKSLVRSDPYRARRLLEAAGILVILSPQARAQAKKLKAMIEVRGDDGGSPYLGDGTSGWTIGVDVGDFSNLTDCLDMLDGMSCASDFTGADGGDSGGADGGGDGGGGGD